MHYRIQLICFFLFQHVNSIRNPLLVHIAEQQGRSSTTEAYVYRHRLVTRTSTALATINNHDNFGPETVTSYWNYYQPKPTFSNEITQSNRTENLCPRQRNVHRNCQRSCQGTNQNTNCRYQKICVCDHNCGFSCLSR
ncbi:unnamed protein product, partial [Adineta ricciae]